MRDKAIQILREMKERYPAIFGSFELEVVLQSLVKDDPDSRESQEEDVASF